MPEFLLLKETRNSNDVVAMGTQALQSNDTIVLLNERFVDSIRLLAKMGILPEGDALQKFLGQMAKNKANASPLGHKSFKLAYDEIGKLQECVDAETQLYYVAVAKFERLLRAHGLADGDTPNPRAV